MASKRKARAAPTTPQRHGVRSRRAVPTQIQPEDKTLNDLLEKVTKEKRATIIERPYLVEERGLEENIQGKKRGHIKERDARYIRWYFNKGLSRNITNKIIETLKGEATTAFLIKYGYEVLLRNIEKEWEEEQEYMVYYTNMPTSRRTRDMEQAQNIMNDFEKRRLDFNKIKRPSTKWVYIRSLLPSVSKTTF